MVKGIVDKPFLITLRTIIIMVFGAITGTAIGVVWVFATFVTQDDLVTHTSSIKTEVGTLAGDFQQHVEATTIWQLETRLEDNTDKRRALKRRMGEPGGNTVDNRIYDTDLENRETKLSKSITCLQNSGSHCLNSADGG